MSKGCPGRIQGKKGLSGRGKGICDVSYVKTPWAMQEAAGTHITVRSPMLML